MDILKGLLLFFLLGIGQTVYAQVLFQSRTVSAANNNQPRLTIPNPAGITPGDLLLAMVGIRNTNMQVNLTAPGWIPLLAQTAGDPVMAIYYKVATATDATAANFNFTRTPASNHPMAGAILHYTGVDTTNPIDVFGTNNRGHGTPTAPEVVTQHDDTSVVSLYAQSNNHVTDITQPPGTTERVEHHSNPGGAGISIGVADRPQPVAGTTGHGHFTGGTSAPWMAVTLVLRPQSPTVAVIGSVKLLPVSVSEFLGFLSELGGQQLLHLLRSWDGDAADALTGAKIDKIVDALRAYLDPDGDGQFVLFGWETLLEQGTMGFYVDRQSTANGDWLRVNEELLPSLLSPLGGNYILMDPDVVSGGSYRYRLIEQESDGGTNSFGPYVLKMP